jgi:hypothetical protein
MTYHHPHPPTTPTTVIHCSRDGSSSVSPGAGGNCCSLAHRACYEPTTPRAASSGMGPTQRRRRRHGVVIVISSCTRRSSHLRVFSDPGAVGERHDRRQRVYPYPSGPWLVTLGLWVQVHSQVWVACVVPASGFIVASLACVPLIFDQSGSLAHDLLGRMRCS